MYRRNTAPPGDGRYSAPMSSTPSDATVGASNFEISVALSVTRPTLLRLLRDQYLRNPTSKNNKGPDGPLVRYCWISVLPRLQIATTKPEPPAKKESLAKRL